MAEFRMPILTADMSAGTLVAWRKKPGDAVKRGDIIATVETDKGVIDVEIFVGGVIEELLVQPGQTVPTGTVLAIVREEAPAPAPAIAVGAAPRPAVPVPPGPAPPMLPAPGAPGRLRISPLAKKLAAELGVDPATVRVVGPKQRVQVFEAVYTRLVEVPSKLTTANLEVEIKAPAAPLRVLEKRVHVTFEVVADQLKASAEPEHDKN